MSMNPGDKALIRSAGNLPAISDEKRFSAEPH